MKLKTLTSLCALVFMANTHAQELISYHYEDFNDYYDVQEGRNHQPVLDSIKLETQFLAQATQEYQMLSTPPQTQEVQEPHLSFDPEKDKREHRIHQLPGFLGR